MDHSSLLFLFYCICLAALAYCALYFNTFLCFLSHWSSKYIVYASVCVTEICNVGKEFNGFEIIASWTLDQANEIELYCKK